MKSFLFYTTISAVILHLNTNIVDASIDLKFVHNETSEGITVDKKCTGCHSDIIEKKLVHFPASESCEDCHLKNEETHPVNGVKGFSLAEEGAQLCYMCHDNLNTQKQVHYPVADGNCVQCHSPHSSDNLFLLKEAPTSTMCFTCHDKEITENKKVHLPYGQGDCAACHDPHQSNFNVFLKKESNDLCVSCHQKTIWKTYKEKEQAQNSLYIHAAIEMGGCSSCHNPHSSDRYSLLTKNFPIGLYSAAEKENFALCFGCHDSDMLNEDAKNITSFRNGDQNLHFLHINGEKGRNCNSCHDMHSSTNEHLILNKLMFGNWEMQMKYKPDENGGSCAPGCHGETKYFR